MSGAALSTTPTCQDGVFWLVAPLPPRRLLPIGWAVARWRRLAASDGRDVGANATAAVPQPGRRDAVYPGPAAARPEHPRREGPQRWAAPFEAPSSPGCPRRVCGARAGPGWAGQQRAVRRRGRALEALCSGPGPQQSAGCPCLAAPISLLPNRQKSVVPFHVVSFLVITPLVKQEWAQICSPWKDRAIERRSATEHFSVSSEGALGTWFPPHGVTALSQKLVTCVCCLKIKPPKWNKFHSVFVAVGRCYWRQFVRGVQWDRAGCAQKGSWHFPLPAAGCVAFSLQLRLNLAVCGEYLNEICTIPACIFVFKEKKAWVPLFYWYVIFTEVFLNA